MNNKPDEPVDFTIEPFKSMLGLFWKDKCVVCGKIIHHGGEYLGYTLWKHKKCKLKQELTSVLIDRVLDEDYDVLVKLR